jgi:hypothetical protein
VRRGRHSGSTFSPSFGSGAASHPPRPPLYIRWARTADASTASRPPAARRSGHRCQRPRRAWNGQRREDEGRRAVHPQQFRLHAGGLHLVADVGGGALDVGRVTRAIRIRKHLGKLADDARGVGVAIARGHVGRRTGRSTAIAKRADDQPASGNFETLGMDGLSLLRSPWPAAGAVESADRWPIATSTREGRRENATARRG